LDRKSPRVEEFVVGRIESTDLQRRLKKHLLPLFGDLRMSEVSPT
jgi:hypothetical protein